MIVELTREQLQYIKSRLPPDYFFQKKGELKQIDEDYRTNNESHIYEDEQNKCIKLLEELKKTEQFKLLTTKDKITYHKYFHKHFQKTEDNKKKMKIEHLLKIGTIIAKFYKEITSIFVKSKLFATDKEMISLLDELEKRFKSSFEPYQKKCQEQLLKQLHSQLYEDNSNRNHSKIKLIQPVDAEKKELQEKLNQLQQSSPSSLRHIIQYLNLKQSGEYILDIDKLDMNQFRKIFQFVKKRCERKRLSKAFQRFIKDQDIDQDDYSYQSFLSESNELQNN